MKAFLWRRPTVEPGEIFGHPRCHRFSKYPFLKKISISTISLLEHGSVTNIKSL